MKINQNYLNLQDSYLFSTVAKKAKAYQELHPDRKVIKLSIGDVTLPLAPVVVEAMKQASAEMGVKETFRGYEDNNGYDFLKTAIVGYYQSHGVTLNHSEIFVSDGAKSDTGNITDILSTDNTVLIPDPVYPVYLDTNIMDGRRVQFMSANEQNGFLPMPDPSVQTDVIYLCSPNNPTGAAYNREQLKVWVDYAISQNALLLFDAAYEVFVQDPELPRSIYEIPGAEKCAVEFCSLSKTAGFTGVRCSYTIVPQALMFDGVSINKLWSRRQATKFNGVPYVVQRAAEAVFTPLGQQQIQENIMYYRENAKIIADALTEMGIWFTGGVNSPYIWLKCFDHMGSWEFFDYLLENASVVGTPGAGFGTNGEGFLRLTAFGDRENTIEAVNRIRALRK